MIGISCAVLSMYIITLLIWCCVENKVCQGVLANIGYPSETHVKLKSREISLVHDIRLNKPSVLIFCTEHGSITAVLCAKFRNDCTIETDVTGKRDFARLEIKMSFGQISYIAKHPRFLRSYLAYMPIQIWIDRFRNYPKAPQFVQNW